MDKEMLERFRQQLIEKQQEILEEVDRTLDDMTDQTTNIPDPNDRATVESGRSFELRIRDRERKLLSKIEEALHRIEDEEFGVCDGCGEDIGLKRLEARPVTTYCIDCKTLQENKEKSVGAQRVFSCVVCNNFTRVSTACRIPGTLQHVVLLPRTE